MAEDPIIAIVGNVKTHPNAPEAAEALGSALAKARLRILVYSSGEDFLERHIVKGYVASQAAAKRSVQVRYALHGSKPAFPEQQTHAEVFDWRPDPSPDWEVSFYQSLSDADGILLMGGGRFGRGWRQGLGEAPPWPRPAQQRRDLFNGEALVSRSGRRVRNPPEGSDCPQGCVSDASAYGRDPQPDFRDLAGSRRGPVLPPGGGLRAGSLGLEAHSGIYT
jgi:hypothetical protein